MKVHIFGASGSGTTTLGKALAAKLGWIHLDADDYYWVKTDPPYQEKIPLIDRNEAIKKDFYTQENCIISGSMVSWGKEWSSAFDLVVFLYIPADIRMQRLVDREKERYGNRFNDNAQAKKDSKAFIDWARQYDDPKFEGRSISTHRNWITRLNCQVLEIEGDTNVEERVGLTIDVIERLIR